MPAAVTLDKGPSQKRLRLDEEAKGKPSIAGTSFDPIGMELVSFRYKFSCHRSMKKLICWVSVVFKSVPWTTFSLDWSTELHKLQVTIEHGLSMLYGERPKETRKDKKVINLSEQRNLANMNYMYDGVSITRSEITEGGRTWFYLLQLSAIISLRSAIGPIAMIQTTREALLLFLIFYMEVLIVKRSTQLPFWIYSFPWLPSPPSLCNCESSKP